MELSDKDRVRPKTHTPAGISHEEALFHFLSFSPAKNPGHVPEDFLCAPFSRWGAFQFVGFISATGVYLSSSSNFPILLTLCPSLQKNKPPLQGSSLVKTIASFYCNSPILYI